MCATRSRCSATRAGCNPTATVHDGLLERRIGLALADQGGASAQRQFAAPKRLRQRRFIRAAWKKPGQGAQRARVAGHLRQKENFGSIGEARIYMSLYIDNKGLKASVACGRHALGKRQTANGKRQTGKSKLYFVGQFWRGFAGFFVESGRRI